MVYKKKAIYLLEVKKINKGVDKWQEIKRILKKRILKFAGLWIRGY